jgi:hypothetical protein
MPSPAARAASNGLAPTDSPSDLPVEPKMIAVAFNQLRAKGVGDFLAEISPAHRRALKQHVGERNSESANAEIAKQARETIALLTNAKHHVDDIRKKQARIIALTDPDRELRGPKTVVKSNPTLDEGLLPRALGLDACGSSSTAKH